MNTGVLPTSIPVNMAGNRVSSALGETSGGTLPTLTKLSPKTQLLFLHLGIRERCRVERNQVCGPKGTQERVNQIFRGCCLEFYVWKFEN